MQCELNAIFEIRMHLSTPQATTGIWSVWGIESQVREDDGLVSI